MQLRPYQLDLIDRVRAEIRRQLDAALRPAVILEAPTGSGKTAMAAYIARSAVARGGTVAFLCHRRELVEQTSMAFRAANLPHAILAAGWHPRASAAQICSVGTLARRAHRIPPPSVVIWDECHHVGARTWASIRKAWQSSTHIGLTATPQRLDGKGLGRWFHALVPGPSVEQLMRDGYLSPYVAYAPDEPDLAGVHRRGGDYAQGEVADKMGTSHILGGIVDRWRELAGGRKTIAFACSLKHSQQIVDGFKAAGIPAVHVGGNTPIDERRASLAAFAAGDVWVISNVELFGEGFDLAANSGDSRAVVEAVILARPTQSIGLHLQQVGRALRPKAEPAIILDHAGNIARHGLPDDPRAWTLEDGVIEGADEKGVHRRTCRACFALYRPHLEVCPYCGTPAPETKGRKLVEVQGGMRRVERQLPLPLPKKLTFKQWLSAQRFRRDPVAHFADDVCDDAEFPRTSKDPSDSHKRKIIDYLADENASENCIKAFHMAWSEWASGAEMPLQSSQVRYDPDRLAAVRRRL